MMKLSDREWEGFTLEELFTINSGVRLEKKNLTKGDVPFITAISINNGINNFISNNNSSIDSNVLGVNYDGSVVESFYHPYKALFSDSVKRLKVKNREGNKYIYMFLKTVIYKQKIKYEYGYKFNTKRMKKQKILIPTMNNQPDYDFMEQYIKEKYFDVKSQIKEKQKHEINDWRGLNEVEWSPFQMTDVCDDIQRGKRLTKTNQIKGNKPYISSSGMYNGVDNFISNKKNIRQFENSLTLANSGSVGKTFYQPFQYIASDHVTSLMRKNTNKYIYLFISNQINRLSDKYSFNREINDFRIKRERILLPEINGLPDYKFMEQYMKRKENEVLQRL